MKIKLRTYFGYYWWTYVISAILAVVLWFSVFTLLAKPAENEQINITYIGTSFDAPALQSDLYEVMPALSRQGISRITVENGIVGGEVQLDTLLRSRIAGNCDFFMIESAVVKSYSLDYASYFEELPELTVEKYFPGSKGAVQNGKTFGIIPPGYARTGDYYGGKGEVYLFFVNNSVNLGDLYGGDGTYDAALKAAVWLTEDGNV